MDAGELNFDIPDTGAIFAFGKSVPNRFYVKNDKIISMDCGEGHAVMATASGRVFGFGLNDYGQLGVGNKTTQAKPACVKQLKDDGVKATKVACGPTHTLVLADDGIVYGFGNNSDGQITGDEADFSRPVEIEQMESVEVRELAAGRAFSLAVSKKGELMAWGGNAEGCLGQEDPDLPGSPDPMPIHLPGRVATISAGSYHCACVLSDGRLYAWGETERGKLGIRNAEDSEFLFSPQPVPVPGQERVQMVSCGLQHTLVLTESGRVFACGSGDAGQLGLGSGCTYAPTLKPVVGLEKVKVACVSAGERHSMCVCAKTGQLYAFGDPQHGKLGIKASTGGGGRFSSASSSGCLFEPTLVAVLKPVRAQQVVCGTLLTAVLAVPSKARPGSSSDNENDDQLPALRGRSNSLGRSNSFQDSNGQSGSLNRGGRSTAGGLAPLASANGGGGSGRLDKSGRFSPLALRGSSSPRYGSDTDAMKSMKKLEPIKRESQGLGSSRRGRNSTASTKFDSLLNGPSDSMDSQSENEDDSKRAKGTGYRQRGKLTGTTGSSSTSSRLGRSGLKPLKLDSDEDDDKDFGKKGGASDRRKKGGLGRSDSPTPLSSRGRDRLPSIGGGASKSTRFSARPATGGTTTATDSQEDDDDDDKARGSRGRGGWRKSSVGEDAASTAGSKGGDGGVAKGVGCGRGRRRSGDGGKPARTCQLL